MISKVPSGRDLASADASPRVSGLAKQVEDLKKEIEVLSSPSSRNTPLRSPLSSGFGGRDYGLDASRLKSLNDEISTWKDRSENLMSELQTSKRKIAAVENELVQSRELLSQSHEAKQKIEIQYNAVKEELALLREVANQNSTELKSQLKYSQGVAARHASDADTVSSHAESLQKKIAALMVEKQSMERAKDDAIVLAAQAKDAAKVSSSEKESIAKELDKTLMQLASLQAKYDSLVASKRSSDAQFEALSAKLESAHSAAQLNEANAAAMAGRACDAQESSALLLKRIEATQERCDAAELSMEALRAQLESTQEELKIKCEEHRQAVIALEDAQNSMSSLKINGGDVAVQKHALLTSKALLEEKIAELTEQLSEKDASIHTMADQITSLTSSLAKIEADVKERECLLQNAEDAITTVKSKSIAEGSEFASQTSKLEEELQMAQKRADDAERTAQEAQELYVNAVESTKRMKELLSKKSAELDETKEFLKAESDRADAISGLLDNREDDLKTLRQEMSEVRSKANQIDGLLEEIEKSKKRIDTLHQELTAAHEEVASLKDELETRGKELEKSIALRKDTEHRIEALESSLADKSGQLEDTRQLLDDAEAKLVPFEERVMQAEMRASDAKSEARDHQIAAEDAQREIQQLNMDLERVKAELEDLQSSLDDENSKIEQASDADDVELKYQEQLSALKGQFENEQALRKNIESELKVEKRRSMTANMKAAGLNISSEGLESDQMPDSPANKQSRQDPDAEQDEFRVQADESAQNVVENLVNSILDKYNY